MLSLRVGALPACHAWQDTPHLPSYPQPCRTILKSYLFQKDAADTGGAVKVGLHMEEGSQDILITHINAVAPPTPRTPGFKLLCRSFQCRIHPMCLFRQRTFLTHRSLACRTCARQKRIFPSCPWVSGWVCLGEVWDLRKAVGNWRHLQICRMPM